MNLKILDFIKGFFKKKQINKTEEIKVNTNKLDKYYSTDGNTNNKFFIENPNLYIRTSSNRLIGNLQFYIAIYRNNYQFRAVIDQLIKRISALDIVLEDACVKKDKIHKKLKVKRINEYIKRQMDNLFGYNNSNGMLENTSQLINTLGESFITGKTILQVKYKTNENGKYNFDTGYYELDSLEYCNPDFFDFLYLNNELVYVGEGDIEILNPYQFIVHTNNGNEVNPHGYSIIGEAGYRLHFTLMELLSDFLEYSKRHGYAMWEVVAKGYVDNITGERVRPEQHIVNKAIEVASKMTNGKSVGHTEDIDIKQIKNETRGLDYVKSIELVERSITKLILGSTTLIQNSETQGSRALGEVHEHSTLAIIEDGAKAMQHSLNKLIYKILDLNGFVDDDIVLPKISIKYRKAVINTNEASYLLRAIQSGAPVNVLEAMKKLKLKAPDNLPDNLTYNGYYDNDGNYVEGLIDKKDKEIFSSDVIENQDEEEINQEQEGVLESGE